MDNSRIVKLAKLFSVTSVALLLASCGGGGGDTGGSTRQNLQISLFESEIEGKTDEYFREIEALVLSPLGQLNTIENVFNDQTIALDYTNCSINDTPLANAFYSDEANRAILCDHLTDAQKAVFALDGHSESSAKFGAMHAMNFVAFHELGHAIVLENDHALGGNAESIADAIAVVLAAATGRNLSAYAAADYFLIRSRLGTVDTYLDSHPGHQDRAGDISCWWLGANSETTDEPDRVAQLESRFANAGRDCVAEYADQSEFVYNLIPQLRNISLPAAANSLTEEEIAIQSEALGRILDSLTEKLVIE